MLDEDRVFQVVSTNELLLVFVENEASYPSVAFGMSTIKHVLRHYMLRNLCFIEANKDTVAVRRTVGLETLSLSAELFPKQSLEVCDCQRLHVVTHHYSHT